MLNAVLSTDTCICPTQPITSHPASSLPLFLVQIIFDEAQRRGGTGASAPLVQLREAFPAPPPRPVPERGTLTIDDFDFPQQFSEFSFRTLLTKVWIQCGVVWIFTPQSMDLLTGRGDLGHDPPPSLLTGRSDLGHGPRAPGVRQGAQDVPLQHQPHQEPAPGRV